MVAAIYCKASYRFANSVDFIGVLSGVNMAGDLKDPQKNIPLGELTAIGTRFFLTKFQKFDDSHNFSAPYYASS